MINYDLQLITNYQISKSMNIIEFLSDNRQDYKINDSDIYDQFFINNENLKKEKIVSAYQYIAKIEINKEAESIIMIGCHLDEALDLSNYNKLNKLIALKSENAIKFKEEKLNLIENFELDGHSIIDVEYIDYIKVDKKKISLAINESALKESVIYLNEKNSKNLIELRLKCLPLDHICNHSIKLNTTTSNLFFVNTINPASLVELLHLSIDTCYFSIRKEPTLLERLDDYFPKLILLEINGSIYSRPALNNDKGMKRFNNENFIDISKLFKENNQNIKEIRLSNGQYKCSESGFLKTSSKVHIYLYNCKMENADKDRLVNSNIEVTFIDMEDLNDKTDIKK